MGAADFRVGGRIFATLASEKQGYGNLMLTPEQQSRLSASFRTFLCRSRADGEGWAYCTFDWPKRMKTCWPALSALHGN